MTASAAFRPSARSKSFEGLYLAGSSAHPGGDAPSVGASGRMAAGLVDVESRRRMAALAAEGGGG